MPRTKAVSASPAQAFNRMSAIADIVALCPGSQSVLAEYGLHCAGCAGSTFETLEQGCKGHGFEDEEIDALVDDLNELLKEMPARPEVLTITLAGARALKDVAASEGNAGKGLLVTVDGSGGFCMEFQDKATKDEKTFFHKEEPDMRVFVSTLTLRRIGGATIDFRDGRFKLDLPEDVAPAPGCGCGGNCDCS